MLHTHPEGQSVTPLQGHEAATRLPEGLERPLLETCPAPLFCADGRGRVIWLNAAARTLLALGPEDLRPNMSLFGHMAVEDRPGVFEAWSRGVTTGEAVSVRCRWTHGSRAPLWIRLDAAPRPEISGLMAGTITDITTSIAARNAVLGSADMLRRLEQVGQTGLWWFYPKTGELHWSDGIFRIRGLEPAPATPSFQEALLQYHEDDRAEAERQFQAATETGSDVDFEARLIRADGALRHVRIRGTTDLDADGTAQCCYGVCQDITAEIEASEALHDTQIRYARSVSGSGIALWDWDLARDRCHVTGRLMELLGHAQGDSQINLDFLMRHVHEDDRVTVVQKILGCLQSGDPFRADFRMRREDSTVWWARARADVHRNDQDRPVWMSGSFLDVTREKTAQLEAMRARDQAQTANRAKSDFLAVMSHEIRTPMNGILGMLDLLQSTELAELQHSYLDLAQDSARALLSLLNDILDFSKLDAGRMELETIDFDLQRTIEGAISILRPRAQDKALALTLTMEKDVPPVVCGDPGRVRQIVLNLLSNAIKFTDEGSIHVSVRTLTQDESTTVVRIEVADTGIGIAEPVRRRLFSRFVQADSSIKRKYGGTGLGLAISKQLCELMDGEIGVDSEEGQGSTFWFTLPFAHGLADHIEAPQDGPAPAVKPCQPLTILLAEDNVVNQQVIGAILSKLGHSYTVAANGADAVRRLQEQKYDLVLMDIEMPEMDGVMATRIIRVLPGSVARVPIVALTANAMAGDREQYLAAGITDYVSKPVDVESLVRAIERCRPAKPDASPVPMGPKIQRLAEFNPEPETEPTHARRPARSREQAVAETKKALEDLITSLG